MNNRWRRIVYLSMVTGVLRLQVVNVDAGQSEAWSDAVAVEEPLEIRIEYGPLNQRVTQNISVTMRTPGNDAELAAGFLFTEGIISKPRDIQKAAHCFIACAENRENVIQVSLVAGVNPHLQNAGRNFYTTSSCGVCGKGSISAIKTVSHHSAFQEDTNTVNTDTLTALPDELRKHQKVFEDTGGLHASALFTSRGKLLLLREDVGRHNALDKLIGAAVMEDMLPLNDTILLLSGRASFELIQKAVMAGINIVVAVGAPSSLAIQLAEEFNITLVGFLRGKRFNIYTAPQRVIIKAHENSY